MFRKIYKDAAKANNLIISFSSSTKPKGYILLADGKRHSFASNDPGLNRPAAIRLAKNKYRCGEVLHAAGLSVPKTVILPGLKKTAQEDVDQNEALELVIRQAVALLVDKVGFPVFVKPNIGSEGRGVYRADDANSLEKILLKSRKNQEETLVQQASHGQEYRVVVLDGKVIMAYQKVPLALIGDGASTIDELLKAQLSELRKVRKLRLQAASSKIDFTLAGMGYMRTSVLEDGKLINPVPSANLAQGAHPVDKMAFVNEHYAEVCERIAKATKLKFMGVDLMIDDAAGTYHVIEVNSKPGFGKYAGQSSAHKQRVAEIYKSCIHFANTGQVAVQTQPFRAELRLAA